MIRRIRVALGERVLVHRKERPIRYLRPGIHWLFGVRERDLLRIGADGRVRELNSEQLAFVPAEDLRLLDLKPHQRAIVLRDGRARTWLKAGRHQVWTLERTMVRGEDGERREVPVVDVEILDTASVAATPLTEDRKSIAPSTEYQEVTAPEGAVAIRYVDGSLDEVLGAGRHAAWSTVRQVRFAVMDLRQRLLAVNGQEVMTRDRVTLRLNLSATFEIADARRVATVARDADEILYLAVQLAAREAVASRSLDELLAARDALAGELFAEVARRGEAVGLAVLGLALKDIVLPGEMKALLNRVIEAQKEAEANIILRREEASATRSLAQTAKILAENPVLMRLKELEAYRDLAAKVGNVTVLVGEGFAPKIELKG